MRACIRITIACILVCTATYSANQIKDQIEERLNAHGKRAGSVAIALKNLESGHYLYQKNIDMSLKPASTLKLLTSVAALKILGSEHKFLTTFYHTGKMERGEIYGDLYVKFGGDPHLVIEDLYLICHKLKVEGLKSIQGDIILDISIFDQNASCVGWPSDHDGHWYTAPISAATINFNTIYLRIDGDGSVRRNASIVVDPPLDYIRLKNKINITRHSNNPVWYERKMGHGRLEIIAQGKIKQGAEVEDWLSVIDPISYFSELFIYLLNLQGIEIKGNYKTGCLPEDAKMLYEHESKPLSQIIFGLNKYSNNLTAEMLVKYLGGMKNGIPGTTGKGLSVLRSFILLAVLAR